MSYMVIRHKVKDYEKWRPAFDSHASVRKAQGCKGGKLYRSLGNPSEVLMIFEWDNLDKARAFTKSEDLRKKMKEAGVVDEPQYLFLEESDSFSV